MLRDPSSSYNLFFFNTVDYLKVPKAQPVQDVQYPQPF